MEEIKINMENLSQEEREYFLKLVKKGQKPVEREWPQEGDDYFCSYSNGIGSYVWDNDMVDNYNWQTGNCFRTREEAEWYREHLKVCAELRRMADGNVNDGVWCGMYFNSKIKQIYILPRTEHLDSLYIFASCKSAKEAINTIGAERLKKYWFRVEG